MIEGIRTLPGQLTKKSRYRILDQDGVFSLERMFFPAVITLMGHCPRGSVSSRHEKGAARRLAGE